jgi:phosphate transport system substrate-binding protein
LTNILARRVVLPGVVALALASLAACGDNNGSPSADPSSGTGSALSGTLSAGGSSAQGVAQTQWITDFQKAHSGVTVTYNPVGSGSGVTSFTSGTYPFAGSDAFLSSDQYGPAKKHCGADPIEVPDYIDPVAVVFNLPSISKLNMSGKVIAEIFDGTITKWNDKAIAALNPGVKLPATTIQPVHRSDDSGTTDNFTDYLAQASDGAWKSPASETWPTTKGLNGDGTSGVVTAAKGATGSIAYIDASQAGGFGVVSVQVGKTFVAPDAAKAANDLAASKLDPAAKSDQMIYDINRTTTDPSMYPILLTSYLVACQHYGNANTAALVKSYLTYVVSQAGQQSGSQASGAAPLTPALSRKATAILAKIG